MIRGLHISKTGMITQQRKQENIANNIVNSNTTGFKKATGAIATDKNLFLHRLNDEIMKTSINNLDKKPKVGHLGMGAFLDETLVSFIQGNLQETGNKFDLAIEGEGFFTIEKDGNIYLTRDGAFSVDVNGNLVNSEGGYLLGQRGRINISQGQDIRFGVNGQVYMDEVIVDNLQVTLVSNPHSLNKMGRNLYSMTNNTILGGTQGQIRQGFLEGSNVDLAEEMVELISTMRAYEANQKAIQTQDETLGKAVNEIASTR